MPPFFCLESGRHGIKYVEWLLRNSKDPAQIEMARRELKKL